MKMQAIETKGKDSSNRWPITPKDGKKTCRITKEKPWTAIQGLRERGADDEQTKLFCTLSAVLSRNQA
jgi:hypothetical protein